MKKHCPIFVFFLLLVYSATAQNPFIKNYTSADGLPTNKIIDVCQDSEGFLWFATDAGVIRFDGSNFVNLTKEDGLSDNIVISIKEDSSKRLWFFNLNGTLNYLFKNKIYNAENAPFLNELKTNFFLFNFYEDADSTLYFYNSISEIYAVKNNEFVDYKQLGFNNQTDQGLFYVNKSTKNRFLFWSARGVYEYKNLDESIILHNKPTAIQKVFFKDKNECISLDHLGNIDFFKNTEISQKDVLHSESQFINSIVIDKNDYVWVATYDKGVYCYANNKILLHLDITQAVRLLIDKENNIWVTSENNGIYKINPEILKSKYFNTKNFDDEGIRKLARANSGGIWATNGESLFLFLNNELFPGKIETTANILNNIYQLKNNTILTNGVGTELFVIKNVKVDYLSQTIKSGSEHKLNYILKKIAIDTIHQKLYSFINDKLTWVDFNVSYDDYVLAIKTGRIQNVFMDRKNHLIINSSKNYLLKNDSLYYIDFLEPFNGQTITSHIILDAENEVFNIIGNNIYIENNGNIIELIKGLKTQIDYRIKDFAYDGKTLFFFTTKTIYFIQNPLNAITNEAVELNHFNIEFNNISDLYIEDSTLYVASNDGLTLMPIKDFVNAGAYPPKPYFNHAELNDEDVDIQNSPIKFKSKKRLSIEFASLNYSLSPSNYAYMMEGVDENWVQGKETKVVYLNLAPGNYIFKVKARKNRENFSEVIELPIRVQPTFFQQTFTKIILFLILIGSIFLIVRYFYKRKIKRKETDALLITLEHKALQSMMNPHFIFNALGSIQRYLLENKAVEASTYLSQFARLIRQNMNSLNSNFISVDNEVERLRNYIDLEKLRMNNTFSYQIEVDDKLDGYEVCIPSMIVQPFVENAIWHGISSIKEKGMIKILFKYRDEKSILVFVEDNGIGIKNTKIFSKSGRGLNMAVAITKKRLKLIGERQNVGSEITSKDLFQGTPQPGTQIKIVVPVVIGEI
ncbi:MAG: histidine kinase [Draconibacterium sp.]|nr:histidine kinase [Draconibacterium sp.]